MKPFFLFSLLLLTGACAKETPKPTARPVQASPEARIDDTQCQDVYDPVCSNGVTYPNACYARKAGVTTYTRGACDGSGGDI
jgi:hypothetical protein